MHAIGLLVDLLRGRLSDPTQRELADKTTQAVLAMERMFGSLLDVSRLDAGGITPQPCETPVRALVDRVRAMSAPLAAAKGLSMRTRCQPIVTRTDPALLERIVGNLVANAIRYTPRGGLLLACRRRQGGIVLSVIDTGIGIPADKLDLVFEEFVRLDYAATADKGLGLGLSIVRRTAELIGVGVEIRSVPGRGTAIHLRLPYAGEEPTDRAQAETNEDGTAIAGSFVLVVDDDEGNREACADLLRAWGCLVASAAGREAALEESGRHLRVPDLVLSDFRLGPGGNGVDLLLELRARCGSAMPAIVLTAEAHEPTDPPAGVTVLRKPAAPATLRAAMLSALISDHEASTPTDHA